MAYSGSVNIVSQDHAAWSLTGPCHYTLTTLLQIWFATIPHAITAPTSREEDFLMFLKKVLELRWRGRSSFARENVIDTQELLHDCAA